MTEPDPSFVKQRRDTGDTPTNLLTSPDADRAVTQPTTPENPDKWFTLSWRRHLGPFSPGCDNCQRCLQYPVTVHPPVLSVATAPSWAAHHMAWGCFPQAGAKPGAAKICWVKEQAARGRYQPCRYRSRPQRRTGTPHPAQICRWSKPSSSSCA